MRWNYLKTKKNRIATMCEILLTNCLALDVPLFQFSEEEVELMAEMEHEGWVAEKLRKGWKYGPTRDDEAKTLPLSGSLGPTYLR